MVGMLLCFVMKLFYHLIMILHVVRHLGTAFIGPTVVTVLPVSF